MEEEISRRGTVGFLLRKLVVDAESVQSDYDAREFFVASSEAEDRLLVHRSESASFGHGLGRFPSGRRE